MRILLAPMGSRGDVQPMLALALGLRTRGHQVEFLTASTFEPLLAQDHGFKCHPGLDDILAKLEQNAAALASPLATARLLMTEGKRQLQTAIDLLEALVPEFDLVVGAGVQLAAASVCEAAGVPHRFVMYVPQLLPSGAHPPFLMTHHGLPPWINRLLHEMSDALTVRLMLGPLTAYRRRRQLPRPPHLSAMILGSRPLLCCSPSLAGAPSDAKLPSEQTGFLALPTPPNDTLAPEVESFLQAGPPPIYLGFGSMVDPDPAAMATLVTGAAREAGVRLIFSAGWSDAQLEQGPELLHIKGAPHDLLLPRCAGAVHHGGAGTVHAAARAGVPQLLVPHLMDQFYWARRVEALGLGPMAIRRPKLRQSKLAAALRALQEDEAQRAAAQQLGVQLQAERGVAATVIALEHSGA